MDFYFAISACVLAVLLYKYIQSRHGTNKIPGPNGLPVIGSALQMRPGYMHEQFYEFARKYGNMFELHVFNSKILVLNSVDVINKAFGTDGQFFNDKQRFFILDYHGVQGTITWRNADKGHRYAKKSFVKGLHVYGDGIAKFENVVKSEIDRVMGEFMAFDGKEFEVVSFIKRSLMNIMSILITGDLAEDEDLKLLFEYLDIERVFMDPLSNALLSYLPFLTYLPYYKRELDKTERAKRKLLEKYFYRVKESRIPGNIRGLTDWFLYDQQENVEAGCVLTDEMIQAMVFTDALVAGVITTSTVLPSIILCLINHPGYQKKLQDELKRVVGDNREPAVSDRHNCHLTEAVIMETMRYITPAPFLLPHVCSEDTELEGFAVNANTQIFANVWYIHHDETIWGDPWTFRPERFLDGEGKLLPNTHIYMKSWMPFGTGRRQCPGMGLATTRIFLYLASTLQRWTLEPFPGKCGSADPMGDAFIHEILIKPKPFYCVAKYRL